MKKLLALFLIISSSYATSMTYNKGHTISVLLHENVDTVLVESNGLFSVHDPVKGSYISFGLLSKRFLVQNHTKGIKWGEQYLNHKRIRIVPQSSNTTLLVNGIQYDGAISIYGVKDKIYVVNDVPIERFVNSILSTKCANIESSEVLSAVSILARTNCYFSLYSSESAIWQIKASDYGYMGSGLINPRSLVQEVMASTIGFALMDESQSFIPATWNENSAGCVASYSSIYRKYNFGKKVLTPFSARVRNFYKWNFSISKKELAKSLGIDRVSSIKAFIDKDSNKVYGIRILSNENTKDFTFFEFQKALGMFKLHSNDFTISESENGKIFHISGYGYGAGVGVCLFTATELATQGLNALDIIKYFYDVQLINVHSTFGH